MKEKVNKSIKLKKNDPVVVITGTDRGKRGKILFVDRGKGRVVVEGVNFRQKYLKPSQESPKGGISKREFPIHASNVMYFCEKCKKGVRVNFVVEGDDKKRVCKKCGKSIN
jgi:large subunit ribosomal protein L24